MPQIAINWCLCKDTTPIPGVKTMRQLEDNLGALGWRLSEGEVAERTRRRRRWAVDEPKHFPNCVKTYGV